MAGWTERDLTSTWLSLLKPSLRDLGEAPPMWHHSSVQFLLQLITELSTSLLGLDVMCSQGFLCWLLDLWRHFSSVGIVMLCFPSEQLILLPLLHSLALFVCFLPRHSQPSLHRNNSSPCKGLFPEQEDKWKGRGVFPVGTASHLPVSSPAFPYILLPASKMFIFEKEQEQNSVLWNKEMEWSQSVFTTRSNTSGMSCLHGLEVLMPFCKRASSPEYAVTCIYGKLI